MFIKLIYKEIEECFGSYTSIDKVREYLQRLVNIPVAELTSDKYYEEIKSTLSIDYESVKKNTKIKELRKKIIALMKKYNKAKKDENNIKDIFSGIEKFVTCQKEFFDSALLLTNSDIAFTGDAIVKNNATSKNRYLMTYGVSSCIAIIIRDSISKRSVLAHISPDSDAHSTQQQLLEIFQKDNIPLEQLEVTLLGGWRSQFSSFNTVEAIRSFWEGKSEVSLDISHLYITDCFELPVIEMNKIIGRDMLQNFTRKECDNYMKEVIEPSQGVIYSSTRISRDRSRDIEISRCIERTIQTSMINKKILTEEIFDSFPIQLVEFIHNSKNPSEKRLTISLFGYPGCCLKPIIFDTETGHIALTEISEPYVIPTEFQGLLTERFRDRCSRNIDELEFIYDILFVEQSMSAVSESGSSTLGRSIASAISSSGAVSMADTSSTQTYSVMPSSCNRT